MTDFPEALDGWTAADWREYRERVSGGESTTVTMDAIVRRRAREAHRRDSAEVSR
ncbi:hypothetical protein AB0E83_23375 [Streptomyces sp. NPDC035033]|uniref:hypothetical protein n=1 Tax=Streptomyces sp. NPDC035033 TaxID=3155368 RepID=UPI0033CE1523